MRLLPASRKAQSGTTMVEILVTLVILLLGLLGVAGLMVQSQRSEVESYQRVQALMLLQDMADRINANRQVASCYAVSDASSGAPYFGTGSALTPTCTMGTAEQYNRAIQDMTDWNNLLLGTSETRGATNMGAMTGARGCVSVDTTTTPPTYTVSVAWQGIGSTTAPPAALKCATGQYGSESQGMRRAVSISLKIATLS